MHLFQTKINTYRHNSAEFYPEEAINTIIEVVCAGKVIIPAGAVRWNRDGTQDHENSKSGSDRAYGFTTNHI